MLGQLFRLGRFVTEEMSEMERLVQRGNFKLRSVLVARWQLMRREMAPGHCRKLKHKPLARAGGFLLMLAAVTTGLGVSCGSSGTSPLSQPVGSTSGSGSIWLSLLKAIPDTSETRS